MRKVSLLTLGIVLAAAFLAAMIAAPAATAGTDTSIAAASRQIVLHKSGVIISLGNGSEPAADLSTSTAFQWGDAGIGAGLVLGLTALAGGGMLLVRRRRGALKTL